MKTLLLAGALLASSVCFADAEDISKVNSPISVDPNQEAGDLSDVNGAIHVGDHCTVRDVSTVNGAIEVGGNSKTGSISTVNGRVAVGASTRVGGSATTVNGSLSVDPAADISGSLTNVNGTIRLAAAHVGGGITTVWGDIEVGKDSRVEHGIIVKKPHGSFFASDKPPPTIIIAPGATVTGTLRFEHEVKLYVSDKAKIGPVEGAKANVYSGDRP